VRVLLGTHASTGADGTRGTSPRDARAPPPSTRRIALSWPYVPCPVSVSLLHITRLRQAIIHVLEFLPCNTPSKLVIHTNSEYPVTCASAHRSPFHLLI
jgi:hypothetical protein